MAKLTYKHREELPSKEFALPGKREFPIEDKKHARNAKARASMAYNEGHISAHEKSVVDHKADRKLGIKEHEQHHWG